MQSDREEQLKNLNEKFQERNYPTKVIDEQFDKAKKKERRKLIYQQRKENCVDDKQ